VGILIAGIQKSSPPFGKGRPGGISGPPEADQKAKLIQIQNKKSFPLVCWILVLSKIAHARFFMFSFRKKESIFFYSDGLRDLLRRQAAIFLTPAMHHGVEVERPIWKGWAKVAVADRSEGNHRPADRKDLVLRNLPDDHGVPAITGYLVAQNGAKTPDQAQTPEIMNPLQKLFFLPAELLSQGLEGGARDEKVSLNQADQFFIFHGKLHRMSKSFMGFLQKDGMIYNIG